MPEMSGVKLAEQLRADGYTGEIVFFTTSNDYASESYGVNAFSYLLKPLDPEIVRSALRKLEEKRIRNDTEGILLKVSKSAKNILFREISHIEVIKNHVYFRLTDGTEIKVCTTFSEISAQLLADSRFIQCHRSYIVNMSDIAAIDDKEITMRSFSAPSAKKIPNSKSYPDVKKKFTMWVGGVL
jgi:DNA-binding LytR/AlgR family response regulator